jgi:glycosyltransferase involved in cell wall biosynthesis
MTALSPTQNNPQRIGIISGSPLDHNPRVLKEASTLTGAGYNVTVLGSGREGHSVEIDKSMARRHGFSFTPVGFAERSTPWSKLADLDRRLDNRLARAVHSLTGIESRFQLGVHTGSLLRAARALRADFYIVHYESALWVGSKLLQAGQRVGIDLEDWYSEDLLPENRKERPLKLLRSLEATLLQKGVYSSCPSAAMSSALAAEYQCRPPSVIYNAFPWSDRQSLDGQQKDRRDRSLPSIHWYSQTLGRGRGLEDLLAALPFVEHRAEIHLRGKLSRGFEEWLRSQVPDSWQKNLFVHDLVSNEELLSRIAEHDIGFAGEMKYCRSRDLTVTNKMLHYLLAGLAVVASDTSGQLEIARQVPQGVRTYPSGNPPALAAELNRLLASQEELRSAKATALAAAERTFSWERQAPMLVSHFQKALSPA